MEIKSVKIKHKNFDEGVDYTSHCSEKVLWLDKLLNYIGFKKYNDDLFDYIHKYNVKIIKSGSMADLWDIYNNFIHFDYYLLSDGNSVTGYISVWHGDCYTKDYLDIKNFDNEINRLIYNFYIEIEFLFKKNLFILKVYDGWSCYSIEYDSADKDIKKEFIANRKLIIKEIFNNLKFEKEVLNNNLL